MNPGQMGSSVVSVETISLELESSIGLDIRTNQRDIKFGSKVRTQSVIPLWNKASIHLICETCQELCLQEKTKLSPSL